MPWPGATRCSTWSRTRSSTWWESPVSGVLRRIIATEGDARPVGALLGVIASADVSDADIDAFIAGFGGGTSAATGPKQRR